MTPHEAISCAETLDHERLGDAVATAAIEALGAAGYHIAPNDPDDDFDDFDL